MKKLNVFCTSIKYFKILDKLPSYITKIGLGESNFPKNWYIEKKGKNISHLNKYYGELTGIYWIWKNILKNFDKNDLIGNCHYRKLWLTIITNKNKKKLLKVYLISLKENNPIFNKDKTFQVQPIVFKNKNLLDDFKIIHNNDSLEKSILFLDPGLQIAFKKHLLSNKLYPLNMFITTPQNFNEYCQVIFPWLEECLNYCKKENLCKEYNLRLPAFLAERFTSFWFSKISTSYFSYARLGKIFLSNKVNSLINPLKLPFTFKMYPTLHKY